MKPRHTPWEYGLAVILVALAFCPRVAKPQGANIQVVRFNPAGYGSEAFVVLPRQSAMAILLPSGDTLWIGNVVVDTLKAKGEVYAPDCAEPRGAVIVSRLKVAINQRIVTEMLLRERGQVALTPNFRVGLPAGDALLVREVYRRKSRCGMTDGLLVVFLVILAPPPGPAL